MPEFCGGFVGYFSYDYIKYIDTTLKLNAENKENFDDFCFMLFNKVIAFNKINKKITIILNIKTNDLENNYKNACEELINIKEILSKKIIVKKQEINEISFKQTFSKEKFCEIVKKAKHYITEGDIFQVVLSNKQESKFYGNLLTVYKNLKDINPSPYMFNIKFDDLEIAGASPESLVSVKNGIATTCPLAGTCKRGATKDDDEKLIKALLENEKELAEHNMLVDLGRNDLGKVCEFGSIIVEEYKTIKKFSHVSHIASKVCGKIKKEFDCLDVIASVIPAGTLSGAPKKRACEIIDELEKTKRGIYGGAIGFIDFKGNTDLCIGIRMAVLKDKKAFVQSGAGIVFDSIEENEYDECTNKAKAVIEAFKNKE